MASYYSISCIVIIKITARTAGEGFNISSVSVPEDLGDYPGSNNLTYTQVYAQNKIAFSVTNIVVLAYNPVEYIFQTNTNIITAGVKHKIKLRVTPQIEKICLGIIFYQKE